MAGLFSKSRKKIEYDLVVRNVPYYPGLHIDDPRQLFVDKYYLRGQLVKVSKPHKRKR